MTKDSIRQMHLQQRRNLSVETQVAAADAVTKRFFKTVKFSITAVLAGYWPIHGEIDDRLILQKVPLGALPCVTEELAPLIFRRWENPDDIKEGRYGIPEPTGDIVIPDILLVPLVAFDTSKHRLGYGVGYYDRTLANLKRQKDVLAVGLAYESQLCKEGLPADENDVKLDLIITDKKVYQ